MRLSRQKLERFARSGHTYYRVWGYADRHGALNLHVDVYHLCGTRSAKRYRDGDVNYVCFTPKPTDVEPASVFDDRDWRKANSTSAGIGAYTKRHQAERFMREVLQGMHPDAVAILINHHEQVDELEAGLVSFMGGGRGDCDDPYEQQYAELS